MYQAHYNIGGILITITAPNEIVDDQAFGLYRTDHVVESNYSNQEESYEIRLVKDCLFPEPGQVCLFQNELNAVFDGDPPLHYYKVPYSLKPFAWDHLETKPYKEIHYLPQYGPYFMNSVGIFNAVGFERILYAYKKYLYHCSYVDYGGRGVVFSAPSGGGKTTQGKLWEEYARAEMINGDRAILEACGDDIRCHGLPIAGSSQVFINRSLPLRAIFKLEKSGDNKVEKLKGLEAVMAVYSQLTINMWNQQFVQDALDFSIYVVSKIPVYKLSCTKSREAVELARTCIDNME